jgi:FixJ family two-component response regulator
MSKPESTVYVVDDDSSVRRSMARLLQAYGYTAQTFRTAEEFLGLKKAPGPGCLILDLQMPGVNGLELQKMLVSADRLTPIIFVSGHAGVPDSVRAMKDGAVDFLTKPLNQKEFLAAIRRALEKDRIQRIARGQQKTLSNRYDLLTQREREVLTQVIKGKLNKQIAQKLGISEKTVKVHRARVMEKMRVGSVAELVRLTAPTA